MRVLLYIGYMKTILQKLIEIEISEAQADLAELRAKYDALDANHANEQVEVMTKITRMTSKIYKLQNLLKIMGG